MALRSIRLAATLAAILAGSAQAAPLTVASYDMPNGDSSTYVYHDGLYTGSGDKTLDNAPLSGGTGVLTDGVIPTLSWDSYGSSYPNGPYVGWTIDPSITITFHFAGAVTIRGVTFHFDDPAGHSGQVQAPQSVAFGGQTYPGATGSQQTGPYALTIQDLSITTASLPVTITRANTWVFLSEVTFDGIALPEPASLTLLGFGLAGLLGARRR
jgi:PEP-CTERM motif